MSEEMSDPDFTRSCYATDADLYKAKAEYYEAKVEALTKAITDFREGNYAHPRTYHPNDCPHGAHYWQDCANCDEGYWQSVLQEPE